MHKDQKPHVEPQKQILPSQSSLNAITRDEIKKLVQDTIKESLANLGQISKPSAIPVANPQPKDPMKNQAPYVSKLKGIPVGPGQTMKDVPFAVKAAWFKNLENRWIEKYNQRKLDNKPVNMGWTRGYE